MQQLFRFIFQNRSHFTFLLLLILGLFLVTRFNSYQAAIYFHTSNQVSGGLLESRQEIKDYFNLRAVNQQMAEENARLRQALVNPIPYRLGLSILPPSRRQALPDQYRFQEAKVINNSWQRFRNYITLNKGETDGLESGMAVIGPEGIVGQVMHVSRNYATATSLLHNDLKVSCLLTSTGNYCTINWQGPDPQVAKLLYLPLHTDPQVGDTVVTSGYNAVFPAGLPIGRIKSFEQASDANFYDVDVELTTDFQSLSYVYVIENQYRPEKDSLEQVTNPEL